MGSASETNSFSSSTVRDDLHDPPFWQTVDHLGVQQARKVAVHPLIAAYELIRET